jgi:hypothetical protein
VVFCLLVDVVLELRLSLLYVPLRLICGIGGMAGTLFLHRLTQEPILILMHLRNLEQMLMVIVLGRRSQPLTAGNTVLVFRILGSRRLVSGSLVITATRSRSERHRCTGRHGREPGGPVVMSSLSTGFCRGIRTGGRFIGFALDRVVGGGKRRRC